MWIESTASPPQRGGAALRGFLGPLARRARSRWV